MCAVAYAWRWRWRDTGIVIAAVHEALAAWPQVLLELPHVDTLVMEKFRQSLLTTPGDKEQRALVKKLLTGAGALSPSAAAMHRRL